MRNVVGAALVAILMLVMPGAPAADQTKVKKYQKHRNSFFCEKLYAMWKLSHGMLNTIPMAPQSPPRTRNAPRVRSFTLLAFLLAFAGPDMSMAETNIAISSSVPREVSLIGQVPFGILLNAYEPLIVRKYDGKFYLALADRIDVSDENEITITIRHDVQFWNGDRQIADGIIASLQRAQQSGSLTSIAELEKVDDYEIRARFTDYTSMLMQLSKIPVLHPQTIKQGEYYIGRAVGTGPFKVTHAGPEGISLAPNPLWSRSFTNPWLDKINIDFVYDFSTLIPDLKSGNLQYADLSDAIDQHTVQELNDTPDLALREVRGRHVFAAFFGGQHGAMFEGACIRQAIANQINENVRGELTQEEVNALIFFNSLNIDALVKSWGSQSSSIECRDRIAMRDNFGDVAIFGPQRLSEVVSRAARSLGINATNLPYSELNPQREKSNWIYITRVDQSLSPSKIRIGASASGRFSPLEAWVAADKNNLARLLNEALVVPISRSVSSWGVRSGDGGTVLQPSLFDDGSPDLVSFGTENGRPDGNIDEQRIAKKDECKGCGAGKLCYEREADDGCECAEKDTSKQTCKKE